MGDGECFRPAGAGEGSIHPPHGTEPPKGLPPPLLWLPQPPEQRHSLGTEVICSQTGIVDLQDYLGVLNGGTENLGGRMQEVGTSSAYEQCPSTFFPEEQRSTCTPRPLETKAPATLGCLLSGRP